MGNQATIGVFFTSYHEGWILYIGLTHVFFRVCVNIATGDLHFTTIDGLILIIPAIGIATVIWLTNEYFFYKRKH